MAQEAQAKEKVGDRRVFHEFLITSINHNTQRDTLQDCTIMVIDCPIMVIEKFYKDDMNLQRTKKSHSVGSDNIDVLMLFCVPDCENLKVTNANTILFSFIKRFAQTS